MAISQTETTDPLETLFNDPETRDRIFKIEEAFKKIASNPDVQSKFPSIKAAAETYTNSIRHGYNDEAETAFLNLYCEIHRAGSVYSREERQQLDQKQGYFNHPGGLSPLFKASPYINSDTVVADLGAGNGLQGLLFQYLYPHRQTLQIELSKGMIQIGTLYQKALCIPDQKILWINDDIVNVNLDNVDFLYLYRPSKPIHNGIALYENLRKKLNNRNRSLTIFSIADCLKEYLNSRYAEFYNDGHLTCFSLSLAKKSR